MCIHGSCHYTRRIFLLTSKETYTLLLYGEGGILTSMVTRTMYTTFAYTVPVTARDNIFRRCLYRSDRRWYRGPLYCRISREINSTISLPNDLDYFFHDLTNSHDKISFARSKAFFLGILSILQQTFTHLINPQPVKILFGPKTDFCTI